MANRVVDGEAISDVPAGAVDEDSDRPVVLVRQLAEPLDARPRRVLLDITDEIDVAQPVGCLLAELGADGVDKLRDQAIAQLSHQKSLCIGHDLSRQPG